MGGMMATTGSNLFKGNQTISGSIIPAVNGVYDLGSSTHEFRHLYLSSASLYIDGTKVLGSTTQELQITTDTGQSFKILESGSDTITLQSNDGNITLATSGGGDVILDPTSGIIALKGSTQVYAGNRILSSDGNAIHFGNGVIISGSLLATGTNIISGSQQISDFGYTTTSSVNTISSSINTRINTIANVQATTGSNNFIGTQTITGSLFISSDLVVQGSSSLQNITASAVNIGANIVNLNTSNPAIRFAGLSIFDSGSIGGSGSFLYDAVQDEFIFVHRGDGTNITSSVVLMGPQTYNNVGNEIYPTTNRLLKGTGNEHVGDSIVSETGGGIGISGSLSISGSIVATGTSLWSGSGQLPSGIISGSAQLPSGTVSGSAQVDVMSTTNIARLATTGSNTFTGAQTINASNVGRINLGNTTETKIAGAIIAQTSPSYGATGKLGFSVTTWGVNTDYDLTEVMAIDMRSADTKGAIIYMNPFGGGRLGVGTQNPTEMLHISGSGSATAIKVETATNHATFFEASTFTGTTRTRLQSNSSAGFVGTMTSHPFDIFANNTFAARYNTNGNLNVGYQGDQGAKLYVQANQASYAAYIEQTGGATSSYGGLRVTTNSTGVYSLRIDNAGTEIFSVKGSGISYVQNALGVGYSDPQYSLQVNGSIGLRANSQNIKAITGTGWGYSPSSYKVVMIGDTENNVTVSIGYDPSGNSNSAFSGLGSEVLFRNGVSFATPTSANTAFHLNTLVMKDGKVGIAKADPAYTLDVNGDAKFVSNSSARVLYLKQNANNSGNIIQFQNESNSDIWEVVGRNNQFYIYNTAQSAMSIYVNPTTNNVGIGSSGTDHRLDVNGNIRINQSVAYLYFTSTTTNRYIAYNGADTYWRADGVHYFEKTSGYKGSWDANSNLTVNGTITESSAIRYKENIKSLENSLDKIIKLKGVSYNKIETGIKEIGFIAEEVNETLPELVLKNTEGEIESVAYGRVSVIIVEAIKELKKEIEELKAKL
jgi:hypothetical protein